jgi:AcrR family transcriptional regulator
MKDGAKKDGGGLRERKRTATRLAIAEAARLLTARRGVNGFTVEEVCERAGISRRTFFNYFPTKEDAILGHPADHIPEELAQAFVTGAAGSGGADGLSANLWEDFIDLAAGMMDRMAMTRSEVLALKQAIMAEPRLLEKATHGSAAAEQVFLDLLARRESLDPGDPRLRTALAVMDALGRLAGKTFFDPENTSSYRDILTAAVADLRAVVLPHPLQPREDRP